MKQTRADTSIAIVQAVLLHALLFALMFAGLLWTRRDATPAAQGEPIEAELVAVTDLSASMQRALTRAPKPAPIPEPAPEPVPEPPKPLPEPLPEATPPPQPKALPAPVPEPAPVEQEKVQRDAPSPDLAKVKREQEAKRRRVEMAELEAKQRQDAERRKQQELAELRQLREQAARARQLAQQKAQQLADARGAPPASPGNRGSDNSLQAKYAAALQQAILRQWTRPETVALGQRCRLTIRQLPGGEVIDVAVSAGCSYDALGRQSVERAVLKASPLPYAGFESVFSRTLELNFVAEDR